MSALVVSAFAYFGGKLRSVSKSLETIPVLQSGYAEIKKTQADTKEQLEKNTNELKGMLEKMEAKMDRRFDTVSETQRSIEKDMNEKVVNLLIALRNYNSNDASPVNSGSHKRYRE